MHLHVIQIADILGVYGLSFIIVLLNGLICHVFFDHQGKSKGILGWNIFIASLLVGGTFIYGHYRLSEDRQEEQSQQSINAVIVQANIDQSIKWDPAYQTQTMETYKRLTRKGYDSNPKLVVWPETSAPFFFQDNKRSHDIFSLVEESGALLAFGSPAYRRISGMTRYYNRAYLLAPDDHLIRYYDKLHLVPFGEYVPLKRFLFFIKRLVPAAGDFEAGDKIETMNYGSLSIGILICFEAIFPELARAHAKEGANILFNLTNDAWFGMTSAPYQHLSMAVFRAVENRLPMIRAANTGFSAFIDPCGKISATSSLFTEEILKSSVNISNLPLTFYTRFGDLFAFSLLVVSVIKILSCMRRKRIRER